MAGGRRAPGAAALLPLLLSLLLSVLLSPGLLGGARAAKRREDRTKCPQVRVLHNLDVAELLGRWYVVQYYASSEEALAYRCMRAEFSLSPSSLEVSMNFTYAFTDDPLAETLQGNITWLIPDAATPTHWVHAEDTYEGVYNTFVLDSDYKSWALLLHCAEKSREPRYLSSFIMSRSPQLATNAVSYLRDKLPRYDIDLAFMFPMSQENCTAVDAGAAPPGARPARPGKRRNHPLKRKNRSAARKLGVTARTPT